MNKRSLSSRVVEMDLKDFFSYPIPRASWEKFRRYQDSDLQSHLDRITQMRVIFLTSVVH